MLTHSRMRPHDHDHDDDDEEAHPTGVKRSFKEFFMSRDWLIVVFIVVSRGQIRFVDGHLYLPYWRRSVLFAHNLL